MSEQKPASASGSYKFQKLDVKLSGLLLEMGLRVDSITLSGTDIKLKPDPFSWELSSPGQATIELLLTDVAAFLEGINPAGLKNFRVEGIGGKIVVYATKRVLVELAAKATCNLVVRDKSLIEIELESVEVGSGLDIRNLVSSQLEQMNPIVNTRELPMILDIETSEVLADRIRLSGNVRP